MFDTWYFVQAEQALKACLYVCESQNTCMSKFMDSRTAQRYKTYSAGYRDLWFHCSGSFLVVCFIEHITVIRVRVGVVLDIFLQVPSCQPARELIASDKITNVSSHHLSNERSTMRPNGAECIQMV